jgi:hypothetical protein
MPVLLASIIVTLLLIHVAGDIVFGFERGNTILAIATLIAGAWLAAVIALGPRAGYALVLLVSCLAPVVPLIHMSGTGVADDVEGSDIALFLFIWTMPALGAIAPVSVVLSLQGLWRFRKGVLGFLVWSLIPLGVGGGLLGFILMR